MPALFRPAALLSVLLLILFLAGCASKDAGRQELASCGPCPPDWKQKVETYAEAALAPEYREEEWHRIYVDSKAPELKWEDERAYGWHGLLTVKTPPLSKPRNDEKQHDHHDIFDWYLRDRGRTIVLVKRDFNFLFEVSRMAMTIGTLGLAGEANEALKMEEFLGRDIEERSVRPAEMPQAAAAESRESFSGGDPLAEDALKVTGDLRYGRNSVVLVCGAPEGLTVYKVLFNGGRTLNDFEKEKKLARGESLTVTSRALATLVKLQVFTDRGTLTKRFR